VEQAAPSRRRDGRTRDTRERMLAVAQELFVAQGFSHTTLQHIADRLELTKAALYYHFPTKTDLVRSVVQPAIDDVEALLTDAGRRAMSPRELLERFFDLHHTHRLVFLALTRDPAGLAEADADNWVPRLAQRFQELLTGPDAGPEQRIRAVMAASGLSRCATLLTDIPADELRATTVDVALQTLGQGAAAGSGEGER
jgi:AcrR family transcriptional regulator